MELDIVYSLFMQIWGPQGDALIALDYGLTGTDCLARLYDYSAALATGAAELSCVAEPQGYAPTDYQGD